MFSKTKGKSGDDSETGKFVNDLKIITEALYADKSPATRPKLVETPRPPDPKTIPNGPKDPPEKEKKKPSLWTWKGLKALTNARNRRFNCSFSLLVHSIDGLPAIFDDTYLVVHWRRRRDGDLLTQPVRVHHGSAEFDEQLTHSCQVHANRSGPHRSAKYESKHFLLYASVYNSPDLDLGRHRVDVTRLLPLTLEELDDERRSGQWTTSFGLSGKARGATLHVTLGYAVVENGADGINHSLPESPRALFGSFSSTLIRRVESLPARMSVFDKPSEDVKDLHEVLPESGSELSDSVRLLYQKLEEEAYRKSVENDTDMGRFPSDGCAEKVCETEWEISTFSAVDKGIEDFDKEQVGPDESVSEVCRANEVLENTETVVKKHEQLEISDLDSEEKGNDFCEKESIMNDLERALTCAMNLVDERLDSREDQVDTPQREDSFDTSLVSDDLIDSVANDLLEMLRIYQSPSGSGSGSKSEPESPRELLLKQFEKDALAHGGLLDLEIENTLVWTHTSSSNRDVFQEKSRIKTVASRLEDLESKALMCEWGLNEEDFRQSTVDFSPPNGGFLRSMRTDFFPYSGKEGSLVMQVSTTPVVVVPAEMGFGMVDVIQGLAEFGIEKLSMDDITGTTIHQIACEAGPLVAGPAVRQPQSEILQKTLCEQTIVNVTSFGSNKEYMSLGDLTPLSMEKIEALSLEDSHLNTTTRSMDEFSALKGQTSNLGGFQLLDVKDYNGQDSIDGPMGISLTLDEWMRFDSGEINDEDLVDEQTCKILPAHHVTPLDTFRARKSVGEKKRQAKGRKHSSFGNNFTVALMVEMWNCESVGVPMLTLVQVERIFAPPKFKFYEDVAPAEDADEEEEEKREGEIDKEKSIPRYKITEVAVKVESGGWKKLCGPENQERGGSRWLLANGMGKKNKHPLLKARHVVKGSWARPDSDMLWSVSSGTRGQHVRGPMLCNGNMRLR